METTMSFKYIFSKILFSQQFCGGILYRMGVHLCNWDIALFELPEIF